MNKRDYIDQIEGESNFPSQGFDRDFVLPRNGESKSFFTADGASEWTIDIGMAVEAFLLNAVRPYRTIVEIPFQEPLRSSIRRFMISIDAYLKSSNPLLNYRDILRGTARGPQYATYLKRVRYKSFLITASGNPMEKPEWWEEIPSYPIKDIGDIFNYQYLIHWKEKVEDYKYGMIPLKLNREMLNKFRETFASMATDLEIDIVDPREILLSSSGSICVSPVTQKKKKVYEVKQTHNKFSQERKVGTRSVIQVGPENSRDTVINQLDDLNTIRLIENQIAKIINKNFISYTVNQNSEDFDKKYTKFKDDHRWFLCRDLTKEGITKPRELLTIMLEELHNLYPDVPAFEYYKFYKDYDLLVDDERISMLRGHGLGMANSLTTLMQICIHIMVLKEMEVNSDDIELLTLNDDAIVGTHKQFELEEYWDKEEPILSGLGLIRNPKKSFICRNGGVFIEKYFARGFDNINYKESYQIRELQIAFTAVNIVHAKQIVSSQVYLDKKILLLELESIASFWGYEFFPEEIHYPAFCGGWYNESLYGISLDLIRLDDLPYDSRVYRAYIACKDSKLKPRFKKGVYAPPIRNIFPLQYPLVEEQYRLIFDIGSLYDIDCKYTTLKANPNLYNRAWATLKKIRRKEFLKFQACEFQDFIKEIVRSQNKDFLPLKFMIERSCLTTIHKGSLIDPYQCTNPLLSYLSSLIGIPNVDKNSWAIVFAESSTINSRLTANQRKRLKVTFNELSLAGKLRNDTFLYPEEDSDWVDFQDRYFSPTAYLKVYGELNNPYVPLIKKEYANPIIERKKSVWGCYLSIDQIRALGGNLREFPNVMRVVLIHNKRTQKDIAELCHYINKLYTPVVEEAPELSIEEEVSDERFTYEGVIRVPTPETYLTFLEGYPALPEVKEQFQRVQGFFRDWMSLSEGGEMGRLDRDSLLREWDRLPSHDKLIFEIAHGFVPGEALNEPEEEEVEFNLF